MSETAVNKKKFGGWIIPAAVIAVLILIFSSAYTVRQNQYVVIRQWGKITAINDNPGLAFKIPFVQTAEAITKETLFYDFVFLHLHIARKLMAYKYDCCSISAISVGIFIIKLFT